MLSEERVLCDRLSAKCDIVSGEAGIISPTSQRKKRNSEWGRGGWEEREDSMSKKNADLEEPTN